MPLLRSDLLTHLDAQFAPLATATMPPLATQEATYGDAINQALRALGTLQGDLPTATVLDAQVSDSIALAEYYSLQRFARALALQVDITLDAPVESKKRSQMFTQVTALLALARADVKARGYLDQSWELGRLSLDFIEPITGFN